MRKQQYLMSSALNCSFVCSNFFCSSSMSLKVQAPIERMPRHSSIVFRFSALYFSGLASLESMSPWAFNRLRCSPIFCRVSLIRLCEMPLISSLSCLRSGSLNIFEVRYLSGLFSLKASMTSRASLSLSIFSLMEASLSTSLIFLTSNSRLPSHSLSSSLICSKWLYSGLSGMNSDSFSMMWMEESSLFISLLRTLNFTFFSFRADSSSFWQLLAPSMHRLSFLWMFCSSRGTSACRWGIREKACILLWFWLILRRNSGATFLHASMEAEISPAISLALALMPASKDPSTDRISWERGTLPRYSQDLDIFRNLEEISMRALSSASDTFCRLLIRASPERQLALASSSATQSRVFSWSSESESPSCDRQPMCILQREQLAMDSWQFPSLTLLEYRADSSSTLWRKSARSPSMTSCFWKCLVSRVRVLMASPTSLGSSDPFFRVSRRVLTPSSTPDLNFSLIFPKATKCFRGRYLSHLSISLLYCSMSSAARLLLPTLTLKPRTSLSTCCATFSLILPDTLARASSMCETASSPCSRLCSWSSSSKKQTATSIWSMPKQVVIWSSRNLSCLSMAVLDLLLQSMWILEPRLLTADSSPIFSRVDSAWPCRGLKSSTLFASEVDDPYLVLAIRSPQMSSRFWVDFSRVPSSSQMDLIREFSPLVSLNLLKTKRTPCLISEQLGKIEHRVEASFLMPSPRLPWLSPPMITTNLALPRERIAFATPMELEMSTSGPSVSSKPGVSTKKVLVREKQSPLYFTQVTSLVTDLVEGLETSFCASLSVTASRVVSQVMLFHSFTAISQPRSDRMAVDFPAPVPPMKTTADSPLIWFCASLLLRISLDSSGMSRNTVLSLMASSSMRILEGSEEFWMLLIFCRMLSESLPSFRRVSASFDASSLSPSRLGLSGHSCCRDSSWGWPSRQAWQIILQRCWYEKGVLTAAVCSQSSWRRQNSALSLSSRVTSVGVVAGGLCASGCVMMMSVRSSRES